MTSNYTLKLAHINDTHSHFDANRLQFTIFEQQQALTLYTHSGGYARIGYQLSQAKLSAKANQQSFLFLHGGDSFQGTLYFKEFKGKANSDLLNLLKPDAMVLGNHEIDAGNGPVLDFLNDIQFPLLAGNMDLSQESQHKTARLASHPNLYDYDNDTQTAKYILKPLQDKQVAIVGITLDQMKEIARPDEDTHFINAIETTRRTVAKLHAEGIVHIIVLSHLGLDQDKILAQDVDGISLIVGGHSHTLQGDFRELGLSNMPYAERVNNTPIVHAGKYAENIGIADITFDDKGTVTDLNGGNHFMLDQQFILQAGEGEVSADNYLAIRAKLDANPAIFWDGEDSVIQQAILKKYRPTLDALDNQILGFVPRNLIHTRLPSKALPHGSEIAPLVSRSMFQETVDMGIEVDFALHNAGGVRQSLNKGQLSLAEVIGRILPFDLPLVTYQIQGRCLFEMLESAINAATNNSVIGTGAGSFPYTYGLKYFYDGRQTLGGRIIKLEIMRHVEGIPQWFDIDPEQQYIGVSSAYTASGKEGYSPILQSSWQRSVETLTLAEAFIRFMARPETLVDVIEPQVHYTSHRR
ncbi:bifunctional metallophosphatase/5'-nucleotidase [Shewanella sp. Choline-02u-19]|uniref:bifunctional metallophosphatase/5'-nucleotidase n=1 Tax=unclassified Shewanella TaxID=196818 RepID=UPI000C32EF10|nr:MULTISPECIES: bifunctional metallophosphatase/5'-nucleotidase [unclassified Shewanella]PKG57511.1 bifunctional metallophosphatase/5'-nucleotidase [Shewanella sp. GutDb-MelDb]PKG74777.1 bifunctional metallophosphatase/5'-nucleotidase [Shewanella sp. GutCb]PKH54237.1 bifunctional metallophosphatase/5'-nucleotidase [Shewanella sp. Bg11-22]PKI28208.1 bifunctional metallophosphatase/5'-nucleotidase [Shewanella sp. Choline-02u-19]